jgi:hypothetical protein
MLCGNFCRSEVMMWRTLTALSGAALLMACGEAAPHEYPASAQAQFASTCPSNDPVCACTWDKITRAMTYEEYQEAVSRFRREGLMDPHITHARAVCIEQHPRR